MGGRWAVGRWKVVQKVYEMVIKGMAEERIKRGDAEVESGEESVRSNSSPVPGSFLSSAFPQLFFPFVFQIQIHFLTA